MALTGHVLLYTWSSCSFCGEAKRLLEAHGVAYQERPLDGDTRRRDQLAKLFGTPTMPYVLLDGEPLGGLEELRRRLAEETSP